jgi:hypothetical protein
LVPKNISHILERLDLQGLFEIRDLLERTISEKEAFSNDKVSSGEESVCREILEEKHTDAMTYRLEKVSCGKNCKGCPHGPYWYGYWREGGKTRSKYIGKNLRH